jgi:hypothetical protein
VGFGYANIYIYISGKETPLFAPFLYKMHHLTKTGSGQTQGKHSKKVAFPYLRYEDCQKALGLYSGFLSGYLCLDHRFRWKGKPEVGTGAKKSQEELDQEDMDAEAAKGGLLARCTSGGGAIDWGKRLRVERAPEPANILWENFGHPAWTVVVRRVISALASFVLIVCTVAAFVAAEGYRGSAPSTCDMAVCDDRLEFALLNQNVSFPRAVIGDSADSGVAGIGLSCAHPAPPSTDLDENDDEAAVGFDGPVTEVFFREGLTNSIGKPTCIGGYEFCQGLDDEVRRDLEYDVCKEAYFKARLFSNSLFEYMPWVALVLVNVFLRFGVKRLGLIERHTSKAERALSVAKKLFLAQLINTGLAIWLAHAVKGQVESNVEGAAAADATSGWGVTAASGGAGAPAPVATGVTDGVLGAQWYRETGSGLTVALLINMLLPRIGVYVRAVWDCMCRARCCSCCAVTQEQLNQRYSGQYLDLSERYACLWMTIFSTMFYSSGMPVLLVIGEKEKENPWLFGFFLPSASLSLMSVPSLSCQIIVFVSSDTTQINNNRFAVCVFPSSSSSSSTRRGNGRHVAVLLRACGALQVLRKA